MNILLVGSDACLPGDFQSLIEELDLVWTIERVPDADAAMAAVAGAEYDVVVSEAELPGDSGAELLAYLAMTKPALVRILLQRADASKNTARVLNIAHRIFTLPIRAELLLDTISAMADLRALLSDERLIRLVGSVTALPPPPKLYLALTQLLQDPDADASQAAHLVEQDPAIAAKVLQLCQSAYFAAGREITSVRIAVTRIGLNMLRTVVLAAETMAVMPAAHVDRVQLQQRSLLASMLAARILPGSSSELASTAALLAEIGRLLPGVLDERRRAQREGSNPQQPDHCEAGAYLLGLWGLPSPIVEAVAFHRKPERFARQGFWITGAVHVAVALANDEPVNEEYLRMTGMEASLPVWQSYLDHLQETAAEADVA